VDPSTTSRRGFLKLAGLAGLSASAVGTLAACGGGAQPTQPGAGGSAPAGGGPAGAAASYWFLSGQPQQAVREESVKRFSAANPDTAIKYTEFQNDAYKTKIKTAIGAGQGPTIIWGWGGGGLREYVKNNQVEDLTSFFSENAPVKVAVNEFSRRPAETVLAGTIKNMGKTSKTYTLAVEFMDKGGNVVATETASVGPVAANGTQSFRINVAKGGVYGYRYKPVT